jgi:hypothetical protein
VIICAYVPSDNKEAEAQTLARLCAKKPALMMAGMTLGARLMRC